MLKKHNYILVVLMITMSVVSVASATKHTTSKQQKELAVKAAFIYNFIQFVEWPERENERNSDEEKPIVIGVVNAGDYEKIFKKIENKKAAGRDIVVKIVTLKAANVKSNNEEIIQELTKCDMLFFLEVEREPLSWVRQEIQSSPVLLIGQQAKFLEQGGVINFIKEKEKIRFEINLASAKKSELKIRSKLLKLARRVIRDED